MSAQKTSTIFSISQKGNLKLRRTEQHSQGQWQSWNVRQGNVSPEPLPPANRFSWKVASSVHPRAPRKITSHCLGGKGGKKKRKNGEDAEMAERPSAKNALRSGAAVVGQMRFLRSCVRPTSPPCHAPPRLQKQSPQATAPPPPQTSLSACPLILTENEDQQPRAESQPTFYPIMWYFA